jgi:hypothetical protein
MIAFNRAVISATAFLHALAAGTTIIKGRERERKTEKGAQKWRGIF